jgi:acetyl/propionyl-CoA carboxylase alpha subunit
LTEYVVSGIKTTLPFFTWLLAQPDFISGRFHTTTLDEILKQRNGQPFVEPDPSAEDVAAIAAALQAVLSPASVASPQLTPTADRRRAVAWKSRARAEGLR